MEMREYEHENQPEEARQSPNLLDGLPVDGLDHKILRIWETESS